MTTDSPPEPHDVSDGQTWFWAPEWQAGEREADADIAAGLGTFYKDAEALVAGLLVVGNEISGRDE